MDGVEWLCGHTRWQKYIACLELQVSLRKKTAHYKALLEGIDGVEWLRGHTGWQRYIGCLKLQISFRKRAANYGAF
jgi:hypothetical protein